jgi:hypothetical protein
MGRPDLELPALVLEECPVTEPQYLDPFETV